MLSGRRSRILLLFRNLRLYRSLMSIGSYGGEADSALDSAEEDYEESVDQGAWLAQHGYQTEESGEEREQYSSTEPEDTDIADDSSTHLTRSVEGTFLNERKRSICLPTVFLPEPLKESIEVVLSTHSRKECSRDAKDLIKFLQSRVPPGCEWERTKVQKSKPREKRVTISTLVEEEEELEGESDWDEVESETEPSKPKYKLTPKSRLTKKPWKHLARDSSEPKSSVMAPAFRYGRRESIAYVAGRAQACYGTALRALSEIARAEPSYAPKTLLDFGSGIGMVEWAAHELWKESLYEYQCVDLSTDMLDMAKRLRQGGHIQDSMLEIEKRALKDHIPGVYSRQYLPLSTKVKYDVVVSGYSLCELSSVSLRSFLVAALWRKTHDYLVLIEAGSWSGYKLIMDARNLVLNAPQWSLYEGETPEEMEGHVFAPCPHDKECPLLTDDEATPRNPCHFVQRVQLSHSEKSSFLNKIGCHIENFTYLILKKGKRGNEGGSRARLVQPVKKRSRHILCQLCTSEGKLQRSIFTKGKHRELYQECRKSKWGDTLDMEHFPDPIVNENK